MTDRSAKTTYAGKVYLVGAGPGDPGLITLRGVECLRRADLVLYDYLVNSEILDRAPIAAEKICLGHHRTGREFAQDDINERMIAAAKLGKTVVRLKGGDPSIFGREAEETTALRAAGVAYEIVPGVTAAIAAGGYAEIPVTCGNRASAVALVTGHQRAEKEGERLDYAALADFPGTLVFYMGVHNAECWSRALLDRGKSPQTPVAIVRRSSWPDQEVVRCTLADVTEIIEKQKILPPAVIAVGEAVGLTPERSWFSSLPLFGISVLVTRPKERDDELVNILRGRGTEVLFQPAIAISDPPDWRPLDDALTRLPAFDWLVFSSGNGVRYFFERLFSSGRDARRLGGAKIAAIGPNTAEELFNYRIKADIIPEEYRAEALADALAAQAAGRKFLLIRASRGREVLAERLVAVGAKVEQIVAYSSVDVENPDEAIAARLASGRIDWITATSSSIARSLEKLFGEDLRKAKLASISPVTSAVLRELGLEPAAEARQFTPAGLAEAIFEAEGKK